MAAFVKAANSRGEFDMVVRFENADDRKKVMNDGLHNYYKPVSEKWANDFVADHGCKWVGPFTYYGGTPLDGITFWHTGEWRY